MFPSLKSGFQATLQTESMRTDVDTFPDLAGKTNNSIWLLYRAVLLEFITGTINRMAILMEMDKFQFLYVNLSICLICESKRKFAIKVRWSGYGLTASASQYMWIAVFPL